MQSNTNPLIEPNDTDSTCMNICASLALIQYMNYLEASNDHSHMEDTMHITGQNLLLESIDQAVRYMARMPVSELDGPLREVKDAAQ